ncbi:MAG: PEP-CTERM sorting domain-containing protein [Crocosphaera sp.]
MKIQSFAKLMTAIAGTVTVLSINHKNVIAGDITLGFDSLPTAQGWNYISSNPSILETNTFSVDGARLNQNTLGIGNSSSIYQFLDIVDISKPFTLSFRARVLDEDIFGNNAFGFGAFVVSGTQGFAVGLGTNQIGIGPLIILPGTFDNTIFHDYRIEGSFVSGQSQLFVDDQFLTNLPLFNSTNQNGLLLGDGTQLRNARAEITEFTFQQSESTSIPESSNILGLILVSGVSVFTGIKCQKKEEIKTEQET